MSKCFGITNLNIEEPTKTGKYLAKKYLSIEALTLFISRVEENFAIALLSATFLSFLQNI